jgi:hypothetical protein
MARPLRRIVRGISRTDSQTAEDGIQDVKYGSRLDEIILPNCKETSTNLHHFNQLK